MHKFMGQLITNRYCYTLLLAINFIGLVWGFWWYRSQFIQTPWYLWPFVPNSPLAVGYFILVLLLLLQKIRAPFWEGLAYFGLIKHGLWTVVIITAYYFGGNRYFENVLLWTGHLGMALQAVLFWAYYGLPIHYYQAVTISGWYFLNDYLDYGVGIYPRVDTAFISLAAVRNLSVGYSVMLSLLLLLTAWRCQHRKDPYEERNS